jgi:ribosome-associated toxin RatA of RatAB toxin-antitoxin module
MTRASRSEVIAGSAEDCLAALMDFASYPEWQSAVRSADVVSSDSEGTVVAFEVDARVRRLRYVLRYRLDGEALTWEYVSGDVKDIDGGYAFEDLGDGTTRATYSVGIDPGLFVPGPIRRVLTDGVMRASVRELKARVERP